MHDFLFEVLTEELPSKSLLSLAECFFAEIKTRLHHAELAFNETDSRFFVTPRRLAILIKDLSPQQQDKQIERKGPALDKAYDANGNPTQACIGFARSCSIEISDLITLQTAQGSFVGCKQNVTGKTIFEIMPEMITQALAALPVSKPMRWGNHAEKFIRPIHSVLMLYGDKIIPAQILGFNTSNKTRGHRFMSPDVIEIPAPEQYVNLLKKAFVIADFTERKNEIVKQTNAIVSKQLHAAAQARIDEKLLDEVTSLVEWPVALLGHFDKEFLDVPQEALITSMQANQRYFPVMHQDRLLPHFVTISNIKTKDEQRVIAGNERVLRARLADAAFFFTTDKKIKLIDRVETLKHIVFQNKLGTLFDKTERVQKLAALIAKKIKADVKHTERAALLAKTDLTTNLVGEFPELQGIAGYHYALNDNEPSEVATALLEQYLPRFSGDNLPESKIGCALALADRIDTLTGVFGINQQPTGEKDPFGLRRCALGILRILIERQLDIDLKELLEFSQASFTVALENKTVVAQVLNFIFERLRFWELEQNITPDIFAAATFSGDEIARPYDLHRRIQAIRQFKQLPEAESLSIANKRVSNILAKYEEKIAAKNIDEKLFENDAERELAAALEKQFHAIQRYSQGAQYDEVLLQLATLRKPVDQFFDKVLVMTEDKKQRENRLLLLIKLRELFLQVADIAQLQS